MIVKDVKVSDVVVYDGNAKKHPEEQIELIMKSISEFGFNVPVILTKENVLIAGHGRLIAAVRLSMETVPAVYKENLSDAQVKAYRIMDNKSSESGWDFDLLKEDFDSLTNSLYDLELTGFTSAEISKIMSGAKVEVSESDFEAPELVDKLGKVRMKCPKCGHEFEKKDGKEDQ